MSSNTLCVYRILKLTGDSANAGFDLFDDELINESRSNNNTIASDFIIDIREYDVPYHVRVAIDKGGYSFPCKSL